MADKQKPKKESLPIVHITLVNVESTKLEEYSKKFMYPLIEGLLKRLMYSKV